MDSTIISKPLYRVVRDLTQEDRIEVGLPLAVKELVRLKLKETQRQRQQFQERYGMDFAAFQSAWHAGKIPNKFDFQTEQDYWQWEAAVTDEARLQEMLDSLL
jgi:hypothetical protein